MPEEYVERRNGGYYVAGTRVSLDSLVSSFNSGEAPETIRQNFPSLTLEQIYGAIAFYLGHEEEVDANILDGEEDLERRVPHLSQSRPELYARLQRAREELAKH
jgi:uncharacterized protein (DUF433 family)